MLLVRAYLALRAVVGDFETAVLFFIDHQRLLRNELAGKEKRFKFRTGIAKVIMPVPYPVNTMCICSEFS